MATPHRNRIRPGGHHFERVDQWIWSLPHDQSPAHGGCKGEHSCKHIGPDLRRQQGLPTIEFPMKFEPKLRKIAALQKENTELKGMIKKNEEAIEAHSVRIAELMKNHEHGILTTTTDKLLVDFATE